MKRSFSPIRRSFVGASALMVSLIVGGLTVSVPAQAAPLTATPVLETFTGTSPGGTPWVVPPGVTSLSVTMVSATGGASSYSPGGPGTRSTFTLPVTPGDALMLYGSTAGGIPATRDAGQGYHNGGRGGDKSSGAGQGAGGAGSSALLLNGDLVAEVAGGGGSGGEAKNKCRHCHPLGQLNLGGRGGESGKDGMSGSGTTAGKPGIAGGADQASAAHGKSAATMSQGGGGGGGGGGYATGSGGGAGKDFLGSGSGGGGGGGTHWFASSITPKNTPSYGDIDPGFVTLRYQEATKLTLAGPQYADKNFDITLMAYTSNITDPTKTPRGTLTLSGPSLSQDLEFPVTSAETQIPLPRLVPDIHTITARFVPSDGTAASEDTYTVDINPGDGQAPDPAPGLPTSITVTEITEAEYGLNPVVSVAIEAQEPPTGEVVIGLETGAQYGDPDLSTTANRNIRLVDTLSAGVHQVIAYYVGDDLNGSSVSEPFDFVVERAETRSEVGLQGPNMQFGDPRDIMMATSSLRGASVPTGITALATQEGILQIAQIPANLQPLILPSVILPAGTTEIYASYAGDEEGNFKESVSQPFEISMSDRSTATTLSVDRAETMAGQGHEFAALVTSGGPGSPDPHGSLEILLDGEVIDTVSIGSDSDPERSDGEARYLLSTDQIPNGTHRVTARFVPSAGFGPSESDPVTVTTVPWHTSVSAESTPSKGGPALTALVSTLAPEEQHDTRLRDAVETPIPWGTLQAFLGDETVSDQLEFAEAPLTLPLRNLAPGTHEITVRYAPETSVTLTSEATVTVTIPNQPADSGGASGNTGTGGAPSQTSLDDPLAQTGAEQSALIWAALALLLSGGAGVWIARSRRLAAGK